MKRYLIILLLFACFNSHAQNYKTLTDSALHTMWAARDSVGERRALELYEKAFKLFPKDIENLGLYKASVLAGDLHDLDKAFFYLKPVAKNRLARYPRWTFITGKYFKSEYANLITDPRWETLFRNATAEKNAFYPGLQDSQKEFKEGGPGKILFKNAEDGREVYLKIRNFNSFTIKKERNYSIKFDVTDSLSTAYFVSLPENYNPKKKYPLLFFLHGAVQSNGFVEYVDEGILEGWNRFYTKYASQYGVIMVYLQGSRKYNWMAPDDGFFMVPTVVKEIKRSINVDDNKVFITGHSNGATGSFSYLMKQQSPFAGFYGFNTQPKVRTGGTFLKNIANRSYFNVSTDEDYYFPPNANDTLNVIMKMLNADYQDHRFNGFPHWFPQFDESEPVYRDLFLDISKRSRNPYHPDIYWECDDVKYGRADWIQINKLDTAAIPAEWHKQINFNIHKLLSYDKQQNLIAKDTLLKAFNFPRKSAAVKGYFKNNEFHLQTSAVGALTIFISPEMVDINKPVVVYVNGLKKADRRAVYDKQFILDSFYDTLDRKAIWIDKIEITF